MNMKRLLLLVPLLLLGGARLALADPPQVAPGGIEFSIQDAGARSVFWAGDYNGWSTAATPLGKDAGGRWSVVIPLAAGEHEYKLVVDGNWITDPDNPRTRGEYGNSFLVVNPDGGLDLGGASRAPVAVNSKLFLGGLYYANYKLETIEREGERILLEKPHHDINLGFEVKLNPSLTGYVELNIDNLAELSEMWRTHLNLQRASLKMQRPGFAMELFENTAVFSTDDLLGLGGSVGTYAYDYGYDARGLVLAGTLPYGVEVKALVADAGLAQPFRPDPVRSADSLAAAAIYSYAPNQGYRDDVVLQARRELWRGELLYLVKAARGLKPGNLYVQEGVVTDSTGTRYNYRTVQNQQLQALSWKQTWTPWLDTELEYGFGATDLQAKDRAFELLNGDSGFIEVYRDERSWTLQKTRGTAVGATLFAGKPLEIRLRHSYVGNSNRYEHLQPGLPAGQTIADLDASARGYGMRLDFRRGGFSWRLELSQEEFEFDSGLAWGDHFWLADGSVGAGNSWINGDRLPLDKYGLLGYRSASVIRNSLLMPLGDEHGSKELAVRSSVSSTRLDREAMYWDLEGELRWELRPNWVFLANERYAEYKQQFLMLDESFLNGFLELTYHIGPAAEISLGYGVDPYWFDPLSKRILPHGRREYLAEQGADEQALKENFQRLGSVLKRAEESLEEVKRISLEARFDF